MKFGQKVLKLRKLLGDISQRKLASLLSTSQSCISNWEMGVTECNEKAYVRLEKLCSKKGINIIWRK